MVVWAVLDRESFQYQKFRKLGEQAFVKSILALTVIDYEALAFDPTAYNNLAWG